MKLLQCDMEFIRRIYGSSLSLFPGNYREEYGEELQTVFDLSLEEAATKGGFEVGKLILCELASLPKAILYEHLRERRKAQMVKKFGTYLNFTHGSRREFFSALYPFILVGVVLPSMNVLMRSSLLTPQNVLVNGIGIVLVASLGILFLIGLVAGVPRWSLPYVGFLFSLFSVYGFSEWLNQRNAIPFQSLYDRS